MPFKFEKLEVWQPMRRVILPKRQWLREADVLYRVKDDEGPRTDE
jgi:hypothetical protein